MELAVTAVPAPAGPPLMAPAARPALSRLRLRRGRPSMPSTPAGEPGIGTSNADARAADIAAVKGGAPFPAAGIPRPPLPHATGMLAGELLAIMELLQRLDAVTWQRPSVRDAVAGMIAEAEEVARNRR